MAQQSLLKALLEEEHSKNQKDIIVQEILSGNIEIKELIQIMDQDEGIYSQRGAYVITGIHDTRPELLKPFIKELIACLRPKRHQAIPRAIYRFLADEQLDEEIEGHLYDMALKELVSKKTPIAIKAHTMTIATNIALKYPELKEEVTFAIKDQLVGNTAGYYSRARKELKRLGITKIPDCSTIKPSKG